MKKYLLYIPNNSLLSDDKLIEARTGKDAILSQIGKDEKIKRCGDDRACYKAQAVIEKENGNYIRNGNEIWYREIED